MRVGPVWFVAGLLSSLVVAAPATAAIDEDSPLTRRLQQLTTPDLRSASAAKQAHAVSLLRHGPGSLLRADGGVVVEVRVRSRTAKRIAPLRKSGARVLNVSSEYRTITAAVDERDLRAVGRAPGVESVVEQITPMSGAAGGAGADSGAINTCATGVVSEGDTQLKARTARTQFDVDGAGVKVGILSDSFDTKPTGISASDDIATGDLPGPTNPCGRNAPVQVVKDDAGPESDEGRAMLQIVHDLAPGSPLAFATAFTGDVAFGDNIRALAASGAKVIADDIIYFNEPMYQDGVIAKAVNDVTAQGVAYFSMAFNNNGLGLNSYEAPGGYRSTTCPAAVLSDRPGGANSCMDFTPGAGVDNMFDVNVDGGGRPFILSLAWAEATFGVNTDFDVYVFNGASFSLVAAQNNLITQTPTEVGGFSTGAVGTRQIVIRRYAGTGTPRLKFVSNDNGADTITATQAVTAPDVQGPTIYGHNGAANAQTVGAVPFSNSNVVEDFSSRGPVTYLFGPVNGATPAPPLAAPQVLSKPNVAATDGGITTFFGSGNRFFGTSAAAPHAAAVGALQLEANPALSQAQVKAAQRSTAVPVGALGPNVVGSGLLDTVAAIGSAPPAPPAITGFSGPAATSDTTPTIGFTTTGDLASLSCQVDGGAAAACSSPFTTAVLGDGSHTLAVGATDFFGQSGSGSVSFEVDTKAPSLKLKKKPKKKTSKRKAKFKFDTEPGVDLTCKLDKEKAKDCGSKVKFKVDPGKHKLLVTATDEAGNSAQARYKWKVIKD